MTNNYEPSRGEGWLLLKVRVDFWELLCFAFSVGYWLVVIVSSGIYIYIRNSTVGL